ncbi:hypothetical protein B296_00019379 [Ensete ventricosum]|uniref:Aquaporin n=1 Tax=Ensete ventricosum TaxID=4639 RepID=A0A426Y260_ENSVE|nr:hypothetical protein B296_00019379 [Ensete ventricosum]
MSRAGEESGCDGTQERFVEEGSAADPGEERVILDRAGRGSSSDKASAFTFSFSFFQKVMSLPLPLPLNLSTGVVTFPGICLAWGLVVMAMVYSLGHVSGAHFNPAVTIAFATCGRFPWRQVGIPHLTMQRTQVLGSTVSIGTLRLMFGGQRGQFLGTVPAGSDLQSLVLEFIISFYLMFVISGVATDSRAVSIAAAAMTSSTEFTGYMLVSHMGSSVQIGELAGLVVGATVVVNVLFAGCISLSTVDRPISGASMNPARSLGPAIIANRWEGLWVYIVGPICGTVLGAWAYNLIRFTDKPLRDTATASFLKSLARKNST